MQNRELTSDQVLEFADVLRKEATSEDVGIVLQGSFVDAEGKAWLHVLVNAPHTDALWAIQKEQA